LCAGSFAIRDKPDQGKETRAGAARAVVLARARAEPVARASKMRREKVACWLADQTEPSSGSSVRIRGLGSAGI